MTTADELLRCEIDSGLDCYTEGIMVLTLLSLIKGLFSRDELSYIAFLSPIALLKFSAFLPMI